MAALCLQRSSAALAWGVGALLCLVGIGRLSAGDLDFRPRVLAPLDRFPPITKIPVQPAAKASLEDNELVLGVVVGQETRAYPINMLTGPSREILNDTLGGRAIAATW